MQRVVRFSRLIPACHRALTHVKIEHEKNMPRPKFQKGRQKTGGRRKGVRNIRGRVEDLCNEMGYDPFQAMIAIGTNTRNGGQLRARMAAELAQYVRPKLRAVEHSGGIDARFPQSAIEDWIRGKQDQA